MTSCGPMRRSHVNCMGGALRGFGVVRGQHRAFLHSSQCTSFLPSRLFDAAVRLVKRANHTHPRSPCHLTCSNLRMDRQNYICLHVYYGCRESTSSNI